VEKPAIYNYILRFTELGRTFLHRYPLHAMIVASILAPIGCLFPLLVPAAGIYAVISIWSAMLAAPSPSWPGILDWWPVALWLGMFVSTLLLSVRLFRIRPSFPQGIEVTREMAPELYALIHDMRVSRWQMPIHRIIVTERFHLDIIKTHYTIFPFWSRNTLVIGLPLIQIVPPHVFNALLARKLCQHSLLRNPLLHVLHQLNSAWWQYYETFARHSAADMKLFAIGAGSFALLYHKIVEPIVRLDGLSADRYTLKMINDEDVVQSIEYLFVAGMFVEQMFWPRLRTLARNERKYDLAPFATLGRVRMKYLEKLSLNNWIRKEMATGVSPHWGVASMPDRLTALGHEDVLPLKVGDQSAAEYYFDTAIAQLIDQVDALWQGKTINKWREIDDQLLEEKTMMAEIEDRLRTFDYGLSDVGDYFIWALQLKKLSALIPIARMFFLMRIGSSNKLTTIA